MHIRARNIYKHTHTHRHTPHTTHRPCIYTDTFFCNQRHEERTEIYFI